MGDEQFYNTMLQSDGYFDTVMNTGDDYLDLGSVSGLGFSMDMELSLSSLCDSPFSAELTAQPLNRD